MDPKLLKPLETALGSMLKNAGFKKKTRNWWNTREETILCVQLQLSRWGGDEFYINLGVYIKCLGDLTVTSAPQCHIRHRVQADTFRNLTPDEFHFKDKTDGGILRQSKQVAELLRETGLPWLKALSTESEIKRMCKLDPPTIPGGWARDQAIRWART